MHLLRVEAGEAGFAPLLNYVVQLVVIDVLRLHIILHLVKVLQPVLLDDVISELLQMRAYHGPVDPHTLVKRHHVLRFAVSHTQREAHHGKAKVALRSPSEGVLFPSALLDAEGAGWRLGVRSLTQA